jgi:hypothetical protein
MIITYFFNIKEIEGVLEFRSSYHPDQCVQLDEMEYVIVFGQSER